MYDLETPNRRNISKSAALRHKKGVADHCYADKKVKYYLVKKINRVIRLELQAMCSTKVNILGGKP